MDIIATIIQLIVSTIILAPVLWIAGRLLAGRSKAKFTDALWIAFLGTLIGVIFSALLEGVVGSLIGAIIMFFVWLFLIRHFFDTGWLRALAIAIVAVIIFIIIFIILAAILILIGISLTPLI